jgi:hypothetical protein
MAFALPIFLDLFVDPGCELGVFSVALVLAL